MPYDADVIANLEGEVDDLVTPTTEDVLAHSQDYDAGIVAASALQKSLNGGGGGGGSFNGGTITEPLEIHVAAGQLIFSAYSDEEGGLSIDPSDFGFEIFNAAQTVFSVGPTGAVTISPPDTSASTPLTIKGGTDAGANFETLINVTDEADQHVFQVDAAGDMYVNLRQDGAEFVVSGNASNLIHATRDGADDKLSFFGATPVAQQSVVIGINEIHAALVNLGLIVEAP